MEYGGVATKRFYKKTTDWIVTAKCIMDDKTYKEKIFWFSMSVISK